MKESRGRQRMMLIGTIVVLGLFGLLWWALPSAGG